MRIIVILWTLFYSFVGDYFGFISANVNSGSVCNRDSSSTRAGRTRGDNGFRLKIIGTPPPEKYTPEQVYTVSLTGTLPNQKLLGFMLVAVPHNARDESTSMGTFQHFTDGLTKFAEKCPHVVTHTYYHRRPSVSVLWTAPPAGTGCLEFRATVIEYEDIWYKDDGALTKVFCEETGTSETAPQELLPDCCACGVAKYQMTFNGLWSRQTHPKDFPKNKNLLHWSNIVGASHDREYIPWQYGMLASDGVKQVCEYGYPKKVEIEMKNQSAHVRTVIKTTGIWIDLRQSRWARFSVNQSHHFMTMLTMIGPSPDWCVGVSSLDLCMANCSWAGDKEIKLYPWDAGTDGGSSYMSPNQPLNPPEKIHKITNSTPSNPHSPFYGPDPIPPLATLSIRRIYPKPGSSPICTGNIEDDLDTFAQPKIKTQVKVNLPEGKCAMSDWTDWGHCSITCGVGMRVRRRSYLNTMATQEMCGQPTMQKEKCIGIENECHGTSGDELGTECGVSKWSEWAPCSVTCGKGMQERIRMYLNKMDMKRCNRTLEDVQVCMVEPLDCVASKNYTALCIAAKDPGFCQGSFMRWYYDTDMQKCLPFRYTGCSGNDNRFLTMEECMDICVKRIQLEEPAIEPSETTTPVPEIETTETAEPIPCMVTEWTEWSPCPVTCGRGYIFKQRMIKRPAENGGKPCPRKLKRKKKCKMGRCSSSCKLGEWQEWTPCATTCGDSVQERTRPIIRGPRENRGTCDDRLQRRWCKLPPCTLTNKRKRVTDLERFRPVAGDARRNRRRHTGK